MPALLLAAVPAVFFVIAFLGLAFVLAVTVGPPLANLLQQIPIVGPDLARRVLGALYSAQENMHQWINQNVDPLVQLIWAPVNAFVTFLNDTFKWAGSVTNALLALAQVAGGAAGGVAHKIADLVLQVAAHAVQIGNLTTVVDGIQRYFSNALTVTVPSLINAAVGALHTLLNAALHVETAARVVAVSELAAIVTTLNTAALDAIKVGDAILAHQLAHTAAALAAAIVAAEAQGVAYTDGVAQQLDLDIANLKKVVIPGALAIAMTAITAVSVRIDTLDKECISPTCSALGAGLDLFALLQAGVELLLLVQLLGMAISDPARAARDLADGVDEIVGLARGVLVSLGVKV